ncbi:MAG: anaerobic C4-dicarboxylate transporter [Bacteroidota bacterium]|nr:anaerobic C4-dicarboxylate transporter [Bacteroidota bacterium]
MFWIELIIVLLAIFIGARLGGIGLGVMGALGLAILTFGFHLQPTTAPIDVMLMIVSVVTAAGAMQAALGLDYLVLLAEKILRRHPSRITYYGPLVTYLFTFVAGTGHVAYSILPVIAEVATETKVRPERPLSISVIASQQAITASPMSAATAAILALLTPMGITLPNILMICIPSTLIGVTIAAFFANHMGKNLVDDPEYLQRLKDGLLKPSDHSKSVADIPSKAKISVLLFIMGAFAVVSFGSFPFLRPEWVVEGVKVKMGMPEVIEIVMLCVAALIILICRPKMNSLISGSVFLAGIQAVIAIFGIAWMGDTFFAGNKAFLSGGIQNLVTAMPWLFAIALFFMSVLLYSQAATVRALMPLAITLGLPAASMIAMFPAVNGYFFIPNYPTIVAAINFDRTGTTRIGRYVLNHSFMIPGLVATIFSVGAGFILSALFLG